MQLQHRPSIIASARWCNKRTGLPSQTEQHGHCATAIPPHTAVLPMPSRGQDEVSMTETAAITRRLPTTSIPGWFFAATATACTQSPSRTAYHARHPHHASAYTIRSVHHAKAMHCNNKVPGNNSSRISTWRTLAASQRQHPSRPPQPLPPPPGPTPPPLPRAPARLWQRQATVAC